MDKKTFEPGDFQSILTEKMHKGLGQDHHATHSQEMAGRCAAGAAESTGRGRPGVVADWKFCDCCLVLMIDFVSRDSLVNSV
jgi:hypothetical protein